MDKNGQEGGASWEIREEERRAYQATHIPWEFRNRNEILTADDYRLWKQRKRQLE